MSARLQHTTEVTRIRALPRRVPSEDIAWELARVLTPSCVRPGANVALRPWQAYALVEALENGGAFLGLPVGFGKTIVAEMLPRVLGIDPRRAILIAPASMRDKTFDERAALARDGWRLSSPPPRFVSTQELSQEQNSGLLDKLRPALIVIDESDDLANPRSSTAKRIDRYVVAHRDDVVVVAMSGTPTRKSILNYWHILHWCLPHGAPVPVRESEALKWALALDEHRGQRPAPGPLGPNLVAARAWYFRRLVETPGVVVIDGDSCSAPLDVHVRMARECGVLDAHYERFLKKGENPAGVPVSDPLSRYRTDTQLGSGLYLYWEPPPPPAWMSARRDVARFVRREIERSEGTSRPLDTEKQVLNRFAAHPIVEAWNAIRGTFRPNVEVAWVSESALESVEEWLAEDPEPAIVWVGSPAFGERLAARTGLDFYRAQGRNTRGQGLHAAAKGRSLIASWNANKRGFNLQAWGRACICQPPTSAKYLEQTIGRQHRSGREERVRVTLLATSGGTIDAFEAALAEAQFARASMGLTQKVLRADITREQPTPTKSNRYRWARGRK